MSVAIIALLTFLGPLAGIAGLAFWSSIRKPRNYTRERPECRIFPAAMEDSAFVLPVALLNGQRRYIVLVEDEANTMQERTLPVHYTTLRREDTPPMLHRLTSYRRRGKTESPDDDYFMHEAFALVVPPGMVLKEPPEISRLARSQAMGDQ